MRYVWPSDMVYHLWANQSQDSARNSQGNCSFAGTVARSYNAIIANIVIHKNQKAFLISPDRWTSVTDKHQIQLRRSIPADAVRFNVPVVRKEIDWHKRNLSYYKDEIRDTAEKAVRVRSSRVWHIKHLESLVKEANAYAVFFNLRVKIEMPPLDLKKLKEQAALEAKKEEAAAKAKRTKILNAYNEAMDEWIRGEQNSAPRNIPGDVKLRIRGSRIETSLGAVVSLDEAKKLLPLCRDGVGFDNLHNDTRIGLGGFVLKSITKEGDITIGCHFIKRDEIERIALLLNL